MVYIIRCSSFLFVSNYVLFCDPLNISTAFCPLLFILSDAVPCVCNCCYTGFAVVESHDKIVF